MNVKFWQEKPSIYDEPIEKVLNAMKAYDPVDPEYQGLLKRLDELNELKRGKARRFNVSPDTAAIVIGNLVGILIIVAYEQAHPMTSKGLNYIKPNKP